MLVFLPLLVPGAGPEQLGSEADVAPGVPAFGTGVGAGPRSHVITNIALHCTLGASGYQDIRIRPNVSRTLSLAHHHVRLLLHDLDVPHEGVLVGDVQLEGLQAARVLREDLGRVRMRRYIGRRLAP